MKWYHWIIAIVLFCIGWRIGTTYLNNNNVVVQHPFPKLGKAYPIIKDFDRMLCLTSGLKWYSVKEKSTGREYLVWFGHNDKKGETIFVIDNEERNDWIRLTREEYFEGFDDIDKTMANE